MNKQVPAANARRGTNRAALLQLIRESGPLSRREMARQLGVSVAAVTRIVEHLQHEGWVRETGSTEAAGGGPGGLIHFTGDDHFVVGIDLGGTKMYGTVADLAGRIEYEQYVAHPPTNDADGFFAGLVEFIESLADWAQHTYRPVRGIGVGVPGIVEVPAGVVRWAPSLQWRDYPLQTLLQTHFGMPVFVENDLNLTALGELGYGAGRGARNLVAVAIGTGIGAGIVIDGAIYRGAHQAAGEIGYLPPERSALGKRYAGFGALESLASGTGIAERARRHYEEAGLPGNGQAPTAEAVFAAARGGEGWAQALVAETVDYLSLGLAAICVVLDPEVIVLGGGVAQSADLLLEPIRGRLEGVIPELPPIVASPLERRAAAMGAIMLVLNATAEAETAGPAR